MNVSLNFKSCHLKNPNHCPITTNVTWEGLDLYGKANEKKNLNENMEREIYREHAFSQSDKRIRFAKTE